MNKKSSFIASLSVLAVTLLICVSVVGFSSLSRKANAQSDDGLLHLSGYAWSNNIGWISFGAPGYGVTVDPNSGEMGGYAWADPYDSLAGTDNIGWISFNETSGCPTAPCKAYVDLNSGKVTGWARVVSNDPSWDGWISLSGNKFESPVQDGSAGSTYDPDTRNFVGYAWDSGVLGWIQLDPPGGGVHLGQCGDGADNNGNGLIDSADPGCHYDNNPDNDLSYDPEIVTETPHDCDINDFTAVWGTCNDGEQSATWKLLPDDNCTGDFTPPTTTQQCIDNGDNGVLGKYTLTIVPAIIPKGGTCNVTWGIEKTTSSATKCTLSGLSVPSTYASFNPKTKSYGEALKFTNLITGTYSLSCKVGSTVGPTITKTCTIAPNFNEF